jgi:hypothetical protein
MFHYHRPNFHTLHHLLFSPSRKLSYYMLNYSAFLTLIGTFEIALLFRLYNSIQIIIIYYLFYYTVVSITFHLIPIIFKEIHLSRILKCSMFFCALGCLMGIIFYSSLNSLFFILIFSLFKGIGSGLYWLPRHYGYIKFLNNSDRDSYRITLTTLFTIISILIPIITGFIITYVSLFTLPENELLPNGYIFIFILGVVLNLVSLTFAPRIEDKLEYTSSSKNICKLLFNKELKDIRNYLFYLSGYGEILLIAIGVLNFILLKNEFNLGLYGTLISALGILYLMFIKKLEIKEHIQRKRFILIGTIGDTLSFIIFSALPNLVGITIFTIFSTIFVPLKYIFGDNIYFEKLEEKSKKLKLKLTDLIIFDETCHWIARTFFLTLFLIFTQLVTYDPVFTARIVIFISGLLGIFYYFFISKISDEK